MMEGLENGTECDITEGGEHVVRGIGGFMLGIVRRDWRDSHS